MRRINRIGNLKNNKSNEQPYHIIYEIVNLKKNNSYIHIFQYRRNSRLSRHFFTTINIYFILNYSQISITIINTACCVIHYLYFSKNQTLRDYEQNPCEKRRVINYHTNPICNQETDLIYVTSLHTNFTNNLVLALSCFLFEVFIVQQIHFDQNTVHYLNNHTILTRITKIKQDINVL